MGERSLEKIHEEALKPLVGAGSVDRDGLTVIWINRTNPLLFLIECHLSCVSQDNVEGEDRIG